MRNSILVSLLLIFIFSIELVQAANKNGIESGYITVSHDLTLYYEQSGHGDKAIVFVPGWTLSTEAYEKQLEYFKDSTEWRFITYDPRGHGRSSKTEGGHFYRQHGQDLNNFLVAMDLHAVVLGGHSYGAFDMLSYVQQFGSERLIGLVMIDAPPKARSVDNLTDWAYYRYDDADGFQEYYTLDPLRDRQKFNREAGASMLVAPTEEITQWLVDIQNQTSDTVAGMLNAAGLFLDYSAELINLEDKIPLLYTVRAGRKDVVEAWAKQHTPSASVVAFGEHMLFWEFSEKYNKVLADYLSTVSFRTQK